MEQRVYDGSLDANGLAQALIDEWDSDDTVAQGFGEGDRLIVQIGQREVGWFSDEPHQAITLDIESVANGLQVTMGQQQWYKDNGVQIFAGGLIGFLPFFFTFPLGRLFGEGIDQRLPSRIWQSVERYAGTSGGAATGKTTRLATIPCPECGVANPEGATGARPVARISLLRCHVRAADIRTRRELNSVIAVLLRYVSRIRCGT